MPAEIFGLTYPEFAAQARAVLPSGAGIAGELYGRTYRSGRFEPEAFPLAAASRAAWQEHFRASLLRVVRVAEEETPSGLTAKAVLATHDGYEIECVRIPMHDDDYTLCLSSQVGCRMGCTFCETGRMGLLRHLTAAEIVGQVMTVRAALGWRPRNLVFMGMGEALDNADQVFQALRVLMDQRALHYSQERLTVCTSGHAEGIARLAAQGWKRLNLSISLNAGDDAGRSALMPVNRRTPLADLQRLLAAYPQRRNFTLGVNWCLLPGINDRASDAAAVAGFCHPLGRVLVNVIPYNPGSAPIARAPTDDEVDAFIAALRSHGLAVRRRLTKGRAIMAACGQLGDVGQRARRRATIPGARVQRPADSRH